MDFARYVESFQSLYLTAKNASVPVLPDLSSSVTFRPKRILILAPHPEDECLMSGFAIRAQSAFQSEVVVVPFSYGSKVERRAARKVELAHALKILEFNLLDPRIKTESDEELTVAEFRIALKSFNPDVVLSMHLNDGHPVHIRSAKLAQKALQDYASDSKQTIHWLQSEFWQSMDKPNLLIPLSAAEIAKMGDALSAHVGEVSRNPYHLTLPAWSMEQVRRGSEMCVDETGARISGAKKDDYVFGQIYRIEKISP